jgi:hypothetical protein
VDDNDDNDNDNDNDNNNNNNDDNNVAGPTVLAYVNLAKTPCE